MRKVIVTEWMSLDGVAQAPGAAEEDTRGGFRHGGWHLPYFDDVSRKWVVENLIEAHGYLFGRRTYQAFAAHWPHVAGEERVIAEPLNSKPKYVVSSTLTEPLDWANSTVLAGGLPDAVRALQREDGGDLLVIGSLRLVHALFEHDLVDELRLMIDPLLLGGGKRTFGPHDGLRRLRLVDCQPTTAGAILATYARAAG